MNLTIRATYPATDGSAPETIEVEHTDLTPVHASTLPYLTDHVRETIRALAAVTAGKVGPRITVSLDCPDEEHLEVRVNGVEIATADHDTDGWAGMNRTAELARALAAELGAEFEDNR